MAHLTCGRATAKRVARRFSRRHKHAGAASCLRLRAGYAAVTQNNGKQTVLRGGHTHLLTHKNWKFEKFITLKIQTDELEKIDAN